MDTWSSVNQIIELSNGYSGKPIYVDTINIEKAGVVHHAIHLKESLQLTLDHKYWVSIYDLKENELMDEPFIFEDYELSGVELKVEGVQEKQYRNDPMEMRLTGTDENEPTI